MGKLSAKTQAYIASTVLIGTALLIWQFSRLSGDQWQFLLGVGALAALAQIFKVEGPTERSSYNVSWVLSGFAFLLGGAPTALFVIVVAHLVEWVWHRYPWYIQSFNIGSYALVVTLAELAYQAINGAQPPTGLEGLVAVLAASAVFTLANHAMIGLVLKLARGQSLAESGVFERLTLVIDFTMFGMGAAGGFIWLFNPYAVVLAAIPLYLIYTTLKVPALQRQTQLDPKTGLFNAPYFSEALEKELARADRYDRPLTVVMADLDLLRNINNTYGHLAGDTALIGVASLLKTLVRDYDIVARFGGEEFAILMPETTMEQASPRIEEIRAAIETARFDIATSVLPLRVTMSFGISGRERFGLTPNDIIHSADLAVYQAKLAGRNRICRYSNQGVENITGIAPQAGDPPAAVSPGRALAPEPEPSPMAPAAALPPAAAQPAKRTVHSWPAWAVNVYVAGLSLLALSLFGLLWRPASLAGQDWYGLAVFAVLAFLTEWLAIDIYVRDTSVSTATAALVAGTLLFGPLGALGLSVAVAWAAMLKHHSPPSRFIFNLSNHFIASMLGWVLALWLESAGHGAAIPAQVLLAIAAGGLSYLSSTWLLAGVIDLSSGQPFHQVWSERFRWLWPHYLALGAVAFALIFSYRYGGLPGVAASLVPLLVVRLGQSQYLNHTKGLVSQLRETNAELQKKTDEISTLNEELLLSLSRAIDLRDPDVRDHSQHVARYATLIAQAMNLPPERVELVRKAGLLHDIGKLGIPEAILFKPGRLTREEYEDVKQHSVMGAEIVGYCHSLHGLVPFIRHHHERYDGRGYPDGLKEHAIPLEARILSVADTVEAMAADRPYRRGLPAEAILAEVRANAGTQFDPLVVTAFCAMVQGQGPSVIINSAHENGRVLLSGQGPEAAPGTAPDGVAGAFNDIIGRLHDRQARRYRSIVEDQTDLICRYLPDGTLTFVNDAYCRYFGKSSLDLIGRSFMPLIPEEDQALVQQQAAQLSPDQPTTTYEHRVYQPEGALRWQQWTDRAIFNPQGQVVEFQSVGRDITERKLAEEALQEANRKLERRNQQLAQILETGNSLRLGVEVEQALRQIVEGVRRALGFRVVAIHLVDRETRQVRVAAHTGLGQVAQQLHDNGLVCAEWEHYEDRLLQDRYRRGRCYFVPAAAANPGDNTWNLQDVLVVPIELRTGEVVGLISVDQPADGLQPTPEALQGLEIFANLAVAALENAWTYARLQEELTESHAMETALRQGEHRLEQALEAMSAGVWEWNLRTGQAVWSAQSARLLGLAEAECPATCADWPRVVFADDRGLAREHMAAALAGSQVLDFEHRVIRPAGEVRWLRHVGQVQRGADGQPERLIGLQIDITRRKLAEQALRESEHRYRLLADNVSDVIWVRDFDLRLTYISPSAEKLCGYPAETALTQSLEDALTPESAERARRHFAALLAGAAAWSREQRRAAADTLELKVKCADGTARWTETRLSLLLDEADRPIGLLGVTRDIGRRRPAETAA